MLLSHNGEKPQVHPSAYVAPSATLCGEISIGPGCRVMHGAAIIAEGGKITIGDQLKSYLEPGAVVPIGWIAVGNPAKLFSPDKHEEIWEIQKPLNFPLTVYGFDRSQASMKKIAQRLSGKLGSHIEDCIITE